MLRNNEQNKRMWALIFKLKIDKETVSDMVWQFTGERTGSTKDMTVEECQAMINELDMKSKGLTKDPEFLKGDKMRKKIISICYEMGWTFPGGKIDMKRINSFCENRTYLHKQLNEYTNAELPQLVTQFEQILKAHYAKG